MQEMRDQLKAKGVETSYMRLKSYPFTAEVEKYIAAHKKIIVIEQNYDGQMKKLLTQEFPQHAVKLGSAVSYDGWPARADVFREGVLSGNR